MPHRPFRSPRLRLAAAAIAMALMAGACTGNGDDPPPSTTRPSAPSTTAAPPVDGRAAADRFFDALASRDPARGSDLLSATAPGSLAQRYAIHQAAARGILGVAEPGSIERGPDRTLVCSAPAVPEQDTVCTEFRDLVFDQEGLVQEFTLGGLALDARLVVNGPAVTVDRITVRGVSAYRSPTSETTMIVLDVANDADDTFELFGFAATYRPSEDAAEIEAGASWGGSRIEAGDTGQVLIRFADAELGGVLQVTGWSDAGVGLTFAVRIAADA